MGQISYDYHGLVDARKRADAAVEALEAQVKTLKDAAVELVSTNDAKGIQAAIDALEFKIAAIKKIIVGNEEILDKALDNTRELHVQNGGEA